MSRRYALPSTLITRLLEFEYTKDLFINNDDFASVYNGCEKAIFGKFYKLDGYLFRESKLCLSNSSMHELLIKKAHLGSLIWHFGINKILEILHEYFFGLKWSVI